MPNKMPQDNDLDVETGTTGTSFPLKQVVELPVTSAYTVMTAVTWDVGNCLNFTRSYIRA